MKPAPLRLIPFVLVLLGTLPASTPEAAVRLYIETVKAEGMTGIARQMHPEELGKFRTMITPVIETALASADGRAVFGAFSDPVEEIKVSPLSDEAFMTTFMECLVRIQPQLVDALKFSEVDVLGHVKEADVSHVA